MQIQVKLGVLRDFFRNSSAGAISPGKCGPLDAKNAMLPNTSSGGGGDGSGGRREAVAAAAAASTAVELDRCRA